MLGKEVFKSNHTFMYIKILNFNLQLIIFITRFQFYAPIIPKTLTFLLRQYMTLVTIKENFKRNAHKSLQSILICFFTNRW